MWVQDLTPDERRAWRFLGLHQQIADQTVRLSRIGRDYAEPVYLAPCQQDREPAKGPRPDWWLMPRRVAGNAD